MNIVYTFDEGYAKITTISIISLLEQNKNVDEMTIFIVNYGIGEDSIKKIKRIIEEYGRKLVLINPIDVSERIRVGLDVQCWSLICYERLFYDELLCDVDKVLHIDCDTLIRGNIEEVYNESIDDVLAGACYDCTSRPKREAGMPDKYQYISNGFLLLNLKKWREEHISEECIKYIVDQGGKLPHLDQDVLTFVLQNKVKILPAQYNVMPITLLYSDLCIKLFKSDEPYYNKTDLIEAYHNPIVVHYTGHPIISKPWNQPCYHPYNSEWLSIYSKSIYKNDKALLVKHKRKFGKMQVVLSWLWPILCKKNPFRKVLFKLEYKLWYKQYV